MKEKPTGLDAWRRLAEDDERLGLKDVDFDTYLARRSQLPEKEQQRLEEDYRTIARNFAEQHFLLFKATTLSWTHDPRTVRILADPKLKELPPRQQLGPLLHACNHLGEEVRARSATGEVVPHAILLGIGVVMGWSARAAAGRIGEREHIAKGGRVGPAPKLDTATQSQVYLWKHDGKSLNDIHHLLSAKGISITKTGIKKAIKREESLRSHQSRK